MLQKLFFLILDILGWLWLVVAGFLMSCIVAYVFSLIYDGSSMMLNIKCILIGGVLVGMIWGTYIWKKFGTTIFLGKIYETPDVDEMVDSENKRKVDEKSD